MQRCSAGLTPLSTLELQHTSLHFSALLSPHSWCLGTRADIALLIDKPLKTTYGLPVEQAASRLGMSWKVRAPSLGITLSQLDPNGSAISSSPTMGIGMPSARRLLVQAPVTGPQPTLHADRLVAMRGVADAYRTLSPPARGVGSHSSPIPAYTGSLRARQHDAAVALSILAFSNPPAASQTDASQDLGRGDDDGKDRQSTLPIGVFAP